MKLNIEYDFTIQGFQGLRLPWIIKKLKISEEIREMPIDVQVQQMDLKKTPVWVCTPSRMKTRSAVESCIDLEQNKTD